MKKFMTVADALCADDDKIVVAGADHLADNFRKNEIEAMIGDSVALEYSDGRFSGPIAILGVEISESLIGKKNVFLKLDLPFSDAIAVEILKAKVLCSNSSRHGRWCRSDR